MIKEYKWTLIDAAESGDMWTLKDILLNDEDFKSWADPSLYADCILLPAVNKDQMEVIEFILTSPDLKFHANIHSKGNLALLMATQKGNIPMVKFFLESPKISNHANIHANDDQVLRCAAGTDFELTKYYLTSKTLKNNANIHARQDEALINAVKNMQLQTVKFLLSSPELKEHANIHAQNDEAFKIAYFLDDKRILKYFIMDYCIEVTPEIKNFMENKMVLSNIFLKRDLPKILPINEQKRKASKI